MIQRSRFVAATAAALALGGATLALADGASENDVGVMGSVSPGKLDKKKFKPVTLYSGVTTSTTHAVPGQQNAEKVTVEYRPTSSSTLTRNRSVPPRSQVRPPIRRRRHARRIRISGRASHTPTSAAVPTRYPT